MDTKAAQLTSQLDSVRAMLSGGVLTPDQISDALSILASMQTLLNVHAVSSASPVITPSQLGQSTSEHLRQAPESRRNLVDIVRMLSPVRAEVEREMSRLKELTASRSWRLTKPLRLLTALKRSRRMLATEWKRAMGGHGASMSAVEQLQNEYPVGQWLVEAELRLLALALPAAEADKVDVYLWGVIDWHFRTQRPQHLSRVLADRGHRVFYISNEFIDRPFPGFTLEPLDDEGRIHQVHLYLAERPAIYVDVPSPLHLSQLDEGLKQLVAWSGTTHAVSILQHPYWSSLVSFFPSNLVIYDCLDNHAGFSDNSPVILEEEQYLLRTADLVVATSQWLADELAGTCRNLSLVRNAGEYEFFSREPARVFSDPGGRKVIGYYGALEAWFDVDLMRKVALRFPEHLVLLIGRDTGGVAQGLSDVANVQFEGEVPYVDLPFWLYAFDVCVLPFKVIPLTLATNPVKIYEYLSAGKPVVSVSLPEIAQFAGVVSIASTHELFVEAIAEILDISKQPLLPKMRREFASRQTWEHRVDELEAAISSIKMPSVSVVVVTYGNLHFTRNCLESLERYSDWSELEVIVVDNGSQDGTPEFLQGWCDAESDRHIILNAENRGFAAATNQGLAAARGDCLVMLNNDTYVTRGWIRGLLNHLHRDPRIGLIGPVTNNIGNQARIDIDYADMVEMAERSRRYTSARRGLCFDLPTLAFFCAVMPRTTYECVGELDDAFEIGFFEDDDYCRRVAMAGLRCVCAEDVFIHHHLSASFDLLDQDKRRAVFDRNRLVYEKKWGPWEPHVYR